MHKIFGDSRFCRSGDMIAGIEIESGSYDPDHYLPMWPIISNNSYAHDEQGVNPGQERGFDGVLYKLWLLLMPW